MLYPFAQTVVIGFAHTLRLNMLLIIMDDIRRRKNLRTSEQHCEVPMEINAHYLYV